MFLFFLATFLPPSCAAPVRLPGSLLIRCHSSGSYVLAAYVANDGIRRARRTLVTRAKVGRIPASDALHDDPPDWTAIGR